MPVSSSSIVDAEREQICAWPPSHLLAPDKGNSHPDARGLQNSEISKLLKRNLEVPARQYSLLKSEYLLSLFHASKVPRERYALSKLPLRCRMGFKFTIWWHVKALRNPPS
ncbi:predicted protein [Sclerotinia sclerotiorum 1980 UF-70]|uniref:Uncharacterized protein n=1 Tax=Sclerotinia sclerotiorum (strain ATCC 18683 / 1980 / Ss-1) TaxID=665079 RepID=A7EMS7_SCLS1|nr:predicted protein [Sclerotinia sclerotiorum 1980 UF-70]EDO04143.1 predicted protein [Sclerotinia sclerotiorum 1980 UF-70]